jgi:hypothetical protein
MSATWTKLKPPSLRQRALAEHYSEQATRLRRMALFLGAADLKANLRAVACTYEGFVEKLEEPISSTP